MTGHLKPPALFIFFKVRRQGLPSTLTVFVMNVASFLGSFLPTPRPRLAFVTAASLSFFLSWRQETFYTDFAVCTTPSVMYSFSHIFFFRNTGKDGDRAPRLLRTKGERNEEEGIQRNEAPSCVFKKGSEKYEKPYNCWCELLSYGDVPPVDVGVSSFSVLFF